LIRFLLPMSDRVFHQRPLPCSDEYVSGRAEDGPHCGG
jgi:hypothetical protein